MKKYLFIAALMLSIIAVATAGAAANDPTPGWDPAPEGHTVTFCHVAGLAEDPANTVTITADEHAVFGQAGHFEENGTPRAGHEQDYLGPCEEPEVPEFDCSGDYDSENNGPNGDCTVDPDPDPDPDPDDPKDPQDPQVPAGEKPTGGVSASSPDVDPAVTSTHTSDRGDLPFTL